MVNENILHHERGIQFIYPIIFPIIFPNLRDILDKIPFLWYLTDLAGLLTGSVHVVGIFATFSRGGP